MKILYINDGFVSRFIVDELKQSYDVQNVNHSQLEEAQRLFYEHNPDLIIGHGKGAKTAAQLKCRPIVGKEHTPIIFLAPTWKNKENIQRNNSYIITIAQFHQGMPDLLHSTGAKALTLVEEDLKPELFNRINAIQSALVPNLFST